VASSDIVGVQHTHKLTNQSSGHAHRLSITRRRWATLFFFMLILLGIESQVGLVSLSVWRYVDRA